MAESAAPVCPVPLEQQPVQEFEQLQSSWFYGWTTLGIWDYSRKFLWIALASGLLAATVAASSFPPSRDLGRFLGATVMGATLIPILALLRLYTGWWYVDDRLRKETIFYEESGWYDGQTWRKPPEMLTRDRLIASFQVAPMLRRLVMSFGVWGVVLLVGGLSWRLW